MRSETKQVSIIPECRVDTAVIMREGYSPMPDHLRKHLRRHGLVTPTILFESAQECEDRAEFGECVQALFHAKKLLPCFLNRLELVIETNCAQIGDCILDDFHVLNNRDVQPVFCITAHKHL